MAIFYPQEPKPSVPLEVEQQWRTLISQTDTGKEYRRRKWIKPKRRIRIKYNKRYLNELENIWNFYNLVNGSLGDFYFIFPYDDYYEKEYIGKGFNYWSYNNEIRYYIPAKEIKETLIVYVDNLDFYGLWGKKWNELWNVSLSWSDSLNVNNEWYKYLSIDGNRHTRYVIYFQQLKDRDYIVFYNYTPFSTSLLTITFRGKLCLNMRFEQNILKKEVFFANLVNMGITLWEVN